MSTEFTNEGDAKATPRVFIGYVGERDKTRAEICRDRLTALGVQTVICEYGFSPEHTPPERVISELKNASLFLAIHSKRSMESPWLHQEMGFFLGKNGGYTSNLVIISSCVEELNNPGRMALLCNRDCLIANQNKRRGNLSGNTLSRNNRCSLESALDKLISHYIENGLLQVTSKGNPPMETIELKLECPNCNTQEDHILPMVRQHHGYMIVLPGGARCSRCRSVFSIDRLTWKPSVASDQDDPVVDKEYQLLSKVVSAEALLAPSDGKSRPNKKLQCAQQHKRGRST